MMSTSSSESSEELDMIATPYNKNPTGLNFVSREAGAEGCSIGLPCKGYFGVDASC